tara:strand:+ start:1331 stop:1741 length:411 start_codon:yes stop_codon:yes gene_type:complete
MAAENFLQALRQAMSPKAHDAIDNAISSNNRMKFQGGGMVNPRGASILDIIKGIEGADIAGMDPYSRLFLDEAIQVTGQPGSVEDFSGWYPRGVGNRGGLDTPREIFDIARLVSLVGETMGDYETGPSLSKHLGIK